MNFINPAYAGAHEGADLRSQWASVQGAPGTQSIFFGTNMGKRVGLGVSIRVDSNGTHEIFIKFALQKNTVPTPQRSQYKKHN